MVRAEKKTKEGLAPKKRSRRYEISRTFAFNAEIWERFVVFLQARAMEPPGFIRSAVEQCASGHFVTLQTLPPELFTALDEVRQKSGFASLQPAVEMVLREWWDQRQAVGATR